MVDREARLFHSYQTTEDSNVLQMTTRPFRGSLSKVYHAEPVRITRYSDTLWLESRPEGEILFEARPNSSPENAAQDKCGSVKS